VVEGEIIPPAPVAAEGKGKAASGPAQQRPRKLQKMAKPNGGEAPPPRPKAPVKPAHVKPAPVKPAQEAAPMEVDADDDRGWGSCEDPGLAKYTIEEDRENYDISTVFRSLRGRGGKRVMGGRRPAR
jgi:hypothetical protein